MFTSTASIQSKTAFFVQEYTHRILTKLKSKSNPTYYTLLDCQQTMCTTMTTYHELTRLEDQISAYDSYTYALARSTALTEQISSELEMFPSVKEFSKRSQKYYMTLVSESAKKRKYLSQIQSLSEEEINPLNHEPNSTNTDQAMPESPNSTDDDATGEDESDRNSDNNDSDFDHPAT